MKLLIFADDNDDEDEGKDSDIDDSRYKLNLLKLMMMMMMTMTMMKLNMVFEENCLAWTCARFQLSKIESRSTNLKL